MKTQNQKEMRASVCVLRGVAATLLVLLCLPSPTVSQGPPPTCENGFFPLQNGTCIHIPVGSYACGLANCTCGNTIFCPCFVGSFCPGGASPPSPCFARTFANTTGLSVCYIMSTGYYAVNPDGQPTVEGASLEVECPAGSYCPPAVDGGMPVPCPAGKEQPLTLQTNSTSCKSCKPGTYSAEGSANCQSCDSSSFEFTIFSGSSVPSHCDEAQEYVDTKSLCKDCPVDTFSFNGEKCFKVYPACPFTKPIWTHMDVGLSQTIKVDFMKTATIGDITNVGVNTEGAEYETTVSTDTTLGSHRYECLVLYSVMPTLTTKTSKMGFSSIPQSRMYKSLDMLVSTTGVLDSKALFSSFTVPQIPSSVTNFSISFVIASSTSNPFTLTLPESSSASFEFALSYCTRTPPVFTQPIAATSMEVRFNKDYPDLLSNLPLTYSVSSHQSAYTESGCIDIVGSVKVVGREDSLPAPTNFKAIEVMLSFDQSFTPGNETRFFPLSNSSVYFVAELASDFGSSLIQTTDTQPPVLSNCNETELIVAKWVEGNTVTVEWVNPTTPEGGVVVISNVSTGVYPVSAFPFKVEFSATDTAKNTARCVRTVVLDGYPSANYTTINVNTTLTHTTAIYSLLDSAVSTYTIALEPDSFECEGSASCVLSSKNNNTIAFRFAEDQFVCIDKVDADTVLKFSISVDIEYNIFDEDRNTLTSSSFVDVHFVSPTGLFTGNTGKHWFLTDQDVFSAPGKVQIRGSGVLPTYFSWCFSQIVVSLVTPTNIVPASDSNNGIHATTWFRFVTRNNAPSPVRALSLTPPSISCPARLPITTQTQSIAVEWAAIGVTYYPMEYEVFVVVKEQVWEIDKSPLTLSTGSHMLEISLHDADGKVKADCITRVDVITMAPSASTGSSSTVTLALEIAIPVCVVGLLLLAWRIRAQQKKNNAGKGPFNFDESVNALAHSLTGGEGLVKPREIKRGNIKLLDTLGSGNWGEVHKGLLEEHRELSLPGYLVAVKTLKAESEEGQKTELLREAAFMAQLNNPFVTKLHGVVTVGIPLMMVMEYCEYGSLNSYISKTKLSQADRVLLSGDCAEGLAYLARRGIVHRDVAARNVLLSSEKRGKIADFGMSRDTDSESAYYHSRGGAVPVRWSAPEALEHHKFSEKSDVWSFGILIYEIWTDAALPYKGMSNQKVWVEVLAGYRLPQPEDCPKDMHNLMLKCWETDTHARPTFSEIVTSIRGDLAQVRPPPRNVSVVTISNDYVDKEAASANVINQDSSAPSAYVDLIGMDGKEITATAEIEAPTLNKPKVATTSFGAVPEESGYVELVGANARCLSVKHGEKTPGSLQPRSSNANASVSSRVPMPYVHPPHFGGESQDSVTMETKNISKGSQQPTTVESAYIEALPALVPS